MKSNDIRAGFTTSGMASLAHGLGVMLALVLLLPGVGSAVISDDDGSERPLVKRVDAIFVIDNSGSMRLNDPRFITRQLVTNFAGELPRGARLGIVLFDAGARLIEPLSRKVGETTRDRWAERMQAVDFQGQLTDSPAGVERALYELRTSGRADADKIIILITDGIVDTGDREKDREKKRWLTEDLAEESRRAGVQIFGIAFTDAADVELIQALALRTGGQYYRVHAVSDISNVLDQISQTMERGHAAARSGEERHEAIGQSDATPPVSSPSSASRLTGLVLLSLGTISGLVAVATPLVRRYRRDKRMTRAAFSPGGGLLASPIGPMGSGALRGASSSASAARRSEQQPIAKLVDVSNISTNGLVPFSLGKPRASVGRDSSNDIVIRKDTVSSFQATIDYTDGYYYLEDHRSTNGTFLNGKQLAENQPVQMKSGDRIDFSAYEFRFIIPDHEPRGRTVVLNGSSVAARADAGGAPVSAGSVERGLEGADATPDDGATSFHSAFQRCLAVHLEKIRALSDAHREFVRSRFTPDLIGVVTTRVEELIESCEAAGTGQTLELAKAGVHYTLVVLPEQMSDAADWFTREYGGYAKLLVKQLESWTSDDRECDAVCVITFGMVEDAWISITIVPASTDGDAVEVMSFEFLSEEERRRALQLDIIDVGRAG